MTILIISEGNDNDGDDDLWIGELKPSFKFKMKSTLKFNIRNSCEIKLKGIKKWWKS